MKQTTYLEIEYETSLYPFVENAEVQIEYIQHGESEEFHKEILACYVSERVPEKRVNGIIERAKEQFYNMKGN